MKHGCLNYGWACPKCGRTYSPITLICHSCNDEIDEKEIKEYEKFIDDDNKLNDSLDNRELLTED